MTIQLSCSLSQFGEIKVLRKSTRVLIDRFLEFSLVSPAVFHSLAISFAHYSHLVLFGLFDFRSERIGHLLFLSVRVEFGRILRLGLSHHPLLSGGALRTNSIVGKVIFGLLNHL